MYDDILGTIEQKPKLRKKIRLGVAKEGKPDKRRRKPRPSISSTSTRGPTVPGIGVGVLKDKDKGLCEDCGEFEDECECEFDLGKLEVEEIMEDDPPEPMENDEVEQCTGCDQCETETDDDDCWDAGGEESKPSKP